MGYRSIRTFHERGEEERNLDFGNESSCIAGLNWDKCFMYIQVEILSAAKLSVRTDASPLINAYKTIANCCEKLPRQAADLK